MTEIKTIIFNWYATPENGEEFSENTVGVKYGDVVCTKIEEHRAAGDGDRWYYDIHFSGGEVIRIFNPNSVIFQNQ